MWGLILTTLACIGLNPIPTVASWVGTTEPALNLLLSIFMGYPLAVFYHKYARQHNLGHIYFIVTGLDTAFFNFGFTMIHNVIPVLVLYLTTIFLGRSHVNAAVTFIFNITYLIIGYIKTESEDYDITWTMPHCVLTLKLIALSFDIWDGHKMKRGVELSSNSKKTALEEPPNLMELFGFVYFPGYLVGPIFSYRRYSDFISEKYPLDAEKSVYESQALFKLGQGVLYLAAFQIGVSVFNVKMMLSDEFWERGIIYRHVYCGLWAHFALYKYISCWLLSEAVCMRFGLTYNGMEKLADGSSASRWDGCTNIKLIRFEGATKFQHYIESFNCNTNHFAAEYVYKRLKFLGNKNLSQFFTLLFLAVWHGTRSGYYMTFFNEFIIILMERDLESMLNKTDIYAKIWEIPIAKYLLCILLKAYTIVFMGWSLIPFDLKVYPKWLSVYSSLYFSGFLLFLPWMFVYKPALHYLFKQYKLYRPKNE